MTMATRPRVSLEATSFRTGTWLDHFGPATVTAVLDRDVELEIAGERHWARLAITATYQPQAGDVVLAMAAGGDCYVVGILEGHGPTVLHAPGDLELRAPNGTIRVTAAEACVVAAPSVRIAADELELRGGTLREEFETVRRRVAGMIDIRVKAVCLAVADTYRLAARRIVGSGDESVAIDAPSITLG